MSNLNLDENTAKFQIRSYQAGSIKINDKTYYQSLIITPEKLIENWTPQSAEMLSIENLEQIISLKVDILLIGSGEKHIFIPLEIYGELLNTGIGVEVMSTGAACRTFNALSAENRNVAAALIIR